MDKCIFTLIFSILSSFTGTFAQGILFSENRLLLYNSEIQTLQVCNPTDEQRTFILSLIDKKMMENGGFQTIPDTISYQNTLKNNLRIFPRTIKLSPHECQEVQLQLRNISNLPSGEYRTFLQFFPLLENPNENELSEKDEEASLQTNVIFRVGAAIPVIYRNKAELKSLDIDSVYLIRKDDQAYELNFTVKKTGDKSVYGTFYLESPDVQGETLLNKVTSQSIYAEMDKRYIKIPIPADLINLGDSNSANLKITYEDGEEKNVAKRNILAEKSVMVTLQK